MKKLKQAAIASGVVLTLAGGPVAEAVSTDGYHTIQIIPIAVQTSSFSTSFYFHNPFGTAVNVGVFYYPGVGTSTASPVNCGAKSIASGVTTYASLTALCPGITAGSNFGWLYTYELEAANRPYAVFTRVDNPQAQGFEVESIAAHHFTAATSHVLGLKRTAGTPGATTNCFIGALGEATTVEVSLWSSTNTQIGTTQTYALAANEFRRLSDVFATVGAPAGNYSNVRLEVFEFGTGEPGNIAFCTVQNNTTFDADFRIAKAYPAQDTHVSRTLSIAGDVNGTFTLGNYSTADRNRHIVWFKHPDWVQCSVARTNGATADLEMRLLAQDGATVIAGGSDQQSFGEVFLGLKSTRGGGANTYYYIEVEGNNSLASGATYQLTCQAGSGVIGGQTVTRGLPSAF